MTQRTIDTDSQYFIGNYGKRDFSFSHASGSYVWDENEKKYLDCTTGIAVNAFGHCYPPVVEAIKSQCEKYIHGSNLYLMEPQHTLAGLLIENTCFDKAFFCNSGTEAIEAAIKFSRKFHSAAGNPERVDLITFENSFHGRTYGALAATGQPKLQEGFGPMPKGFRMLPLNDVEALDKAINTTTAAVLVEPVLAEGGVINLTEEFTSALKAVAEKGVLIIADEIQTGLGRTGYLLASESWGVMPDLITLAKPLGGGLPLGAVLLTNKVGKAISKGDHGTTFGGNPVACAAGVAVLKQLLTPGFLVGVQHSADHFRKQLEVWATSGSGSFFKDLEVPLLGKGLLIGIRYKGDLDKLLLTCREQGLLAYRAGADVMRFLPPLNISKEEIEEVMTILHEVAKVLS
ncbi:MAG: aspartate aminotransferase family protein [Fibrobacteria bacterium]|nr:aspartate aminotransferase family protein [Fibrobacteria bacterium]